MTNKSIRIALLTNDLKQWQLAKLLGMHEAALSRKLRFELPQEEQKRIIEIIYQAKGGENGCGDLRGRKSTPGRS